MKKTMLERLLATTVMTGALIIGAQAHAQTTQPDQGCVPNSQGENCPTEGATAGNEIVVTGSRVARPNAESPSPITSVGAEDIKEFGATKIEDLTNSLPQVFAGQSSGVSNGADGTATVDLRGLGPSRTMVLIDGRRLMPGSIGGGAGADLNFIPSALIASVDLLTGGASATYGADAVAGVVNFKMNRRFRGLRVDAQYSLYQHDNSNGIADIVNQRFSAPKGNTAVGGAYDLTMALGTGFNEDRGSIVAYAGYREETAIAQDQYDYSFCTFNPNATNTGVVCGGSGTPERPRFGGFTAANRTAAGLPAATSYTLTDNNTLRGFVTSDQYNFGPLNYFRRPSARYVAGAFAEYEISDSIKPYMDVMFTDYSTQAQIAPSGAFYGSRTVNCDNPLLAANPTLARAACGANVGVAGTTSSILIGKRNTEGGPRFNDIGYNQFRIVTGLRGQLNEAFAYDAYHQYGQIKVANVYRNDVSNVKIDRALDVVNVAGVPTCRSVVNGTDPACVPYNIFNAGGITQAAASYIAIPLVQTGTTREQIANATLTGDLGVYGVRSPLADDGLRFAAGVEYRKESLATQPDASYIAGDGAGQGGPTLPIVGSYSVTDFFGEAGVPLITDRPFFHDLSLELGYRHSKYNVSGATTNNKADTYKFAGHWSPVSAFTLRGSYNRAVRSPNIAELFTNQQVGLFGGNDPCAGAASAAGTVNGFTAAQCARTGVTAAQFGNITPNTANQYNQFIGGNLTVQPEAADTYSFGAILNPKGFLTGLLISADYYNIKVKNAVGTIGAQVILNQCLANGSALFCNNINRAPASAGPAAGSLWLDESGFVNNRTTNTGSLRSSGIDVNADYRTNIHDYKLRWQFVGTWLEKFISQPITDGFSYDCAGYYGITCGNPNPKYRFNTNVRIATPSDIGMTVRWRYLSKVKVDTISPDVDLASEGASPTSDNRIKAYNYIDLLFSLPIKDTATLRIGVNNIFDKDPPVISQASLGGFGNGNTFPGTYDVLGRQVFVNLTADF